jgi:ABC-2 type transport system permease protein
MGKIWIVARKDILESFRSRSTYVYIVVMFVLTFSYYGTYSSQINSLIRQNASQTQIREVSAIILNTIAYILPMMYSIFVCTIFANYSVVVDKAKHNIESLMVTPISLRQIWMGKALAVTLPSIAIGITVALISYVIINLVAAVPRAGGFVVPEAFAIVTALVIVPALIFAIVALVIYVQLVISNPRIANLVFTAIFLLLLFGVNILSGLGISINVGLIYLGVMAVCAVIALRLSRSLTKEKVVLSSKDT